MVRLSFDISTIILLFAPFIVPKALGWAIRQLSMRQSAKTSTTSTPSPAVGQQPKLQTSLFRKRTRFLAAAVLCLRALVALTWRRPFNIFTSLGDVPLTASISKLSSLLEWHQLSDEYEHILSHLTSMDARLLYTHFGHETFTRCQNLCNPNQPSEYLFYRALILLRTYAFAAILAACINMQRRNWLGIALAAGFFGEIYTLASTEMHASASGLPTLADYLHLYRNIGFIILAISALLMPSNPVERQSSVLANVLQRDVQMLLQHQDQLQLRLRLLEAAKTVQNSQAIDEPTIEEAMPPEQATALRGWLEKIVSSSVQQSVGQVSAPSEVHKGAKIEEPVTAPAKPVKDEEVTVPVTRDQSSLENSSNGVVDCSSSSSMSSPLQTPTPAKHPPPHFDIFASQLLKLSQGGQSKHDDESGDTGPEAYHDSGETVFDQPKLTGNRSGAGLPTLDDSRLLAAHRSPEIAAHEVGFGQGPSVPKMDASVDAAALPDLEAVAAQEGLQREAIDSIRPVESDNRATSTGGSSRSIAEPTSPPDPHGRTPVANDDSGWITVTSKKVRQRYDTFT